MITSSGFKEQDRTIFKIILACFYDLMHFQEKDDRKDKLDDMLAFETEAFQALTHSQRFVTTAAVTKSILTRKDLPENIIFDAALWEICASYIACEAGHSSYIDSLMCSERYRCKSQKEIMKNVDANESNACEVVADLVINHCDEVIDCDITVVQMPEWSVDSIEDWIVHFGVDRFQSPFNPSFTSEKDEKIDQHCIQIGQPTKSLVVKSRSYLDKLLMDVMDSLPNVFF